MRYCYCSKVLPGKREAIINHWAKKEFSDADLMKAEDQFWEALEMKGFESWLQQSKKDLFMIHCLEGSSLQRIFQGLREQIGKKNPIALKLHTFYADVLGKNYSLKEIEPQIEQLLDISLEPSSPEKIKKGFVYPLLPHKEEAHRKFRRESSGTLRKRHEASMRSFDVTRLTSWLQTTQEGKYIVVYSESNRKSSDCPKEPHNCIEWQEIALELMDQTNLKYEELSPDVEWLTINSSHGVKVI